MSMGKKGKKEKRNSVTQEISQLPDPSLVIWAFCPCAVGSTVIVYQSLLISRGLSGSTRFSKSDHKVNYKITIESYPE